MTRHVIGEVDGFRDREIRRVEVAGKGLCLVRLGDEFFALADRCPHGGARLSGGRFAAVIESDGPGHYRMCRQDEMIRCPWHGWEYDVRTGQSWSDPKSTRTRAFETQAIEGEALVKGPYVAETVKVAVEERYVVVDLP
jgi:3-phenylpropionate/trans-cinnamate dioxygenase ferredoxin subunit